jgi:hypothetical protein
MIASSPILETDPPAWASYHEIMNELMQDDRVLPETTRRAHAKWRKKNTSNGNSTLPALDPEILFVQSYLVSNSLWLEPKSIQDLSAMGGPAAVRRALHQQHEEFRSLAGFSPEAVTESLLYEYLLRCLTYMGDVCARDGNFGAARIAWQKLREVGASPRENCVSTYVSQLRPRRPHTGSLV